MKCSIITFIAALTILYVNIPCNPSTPGEISRPHGKQSSTLNPDTNFISRISAYGEKLRYYASKNRYNTAICFLADMKIESGKNRFFVYDLVNNKILAKGLVTHGSGRAVTRQPAFSNLEGGLCTSLGKYKIGEAYHGKFGLAYKLSGLDSTNSNAYKRFVVLHSHLCVPEVEVSPGSICTSWGCPTVSPTFLKKLKSYLDTSGRPVLLFIYQ